jgi:hypothetical protein
MGQRRQWWLSVILITDSISCGRLRAVGEESLSEELLSALEQGGRVTDLCITVTFPDDKQETYESYVHGLTVE